MKRLRPLLLLLLAAFPTNAAAGSPGGDGLPEYLGPLRLDVLERRGLVTFRHSEASAGRPGDAFDGKPGTALRTGGVNPAFLEATFAEPRAVESAQILLGGKAPHEWSVLAGPDPDHMEVVFRRRRVDPGTWSRVVPFHPPLRARVLQVVVLRLDGGPDVEFAEVALTTRQAPENLEVTLPSAVVTPDGMLPARARIAWDGGAVTNGAMGLRFEVPKGEGLRIDAVGPWEPSDVMLRFDRPGTSRVRAYLPGRNGYRLQSEWREVRCETEGRPDWSLGWIERTPRIDFDAPGGGRPAEGSAVQWTAHIRNYGTVDAPQAAVRWEVDGKVAAEDSIEALRRYQEGTATLRLPWDGRRHEIRCTVDPGNLVAEESEGNNTRAVASDALLLGLWVERPLPVLFHETQSAFGDGANGFEDWAQRQVDRWNRMLADARFPATPEGIPERIALDRVVVVDEGDLPLAGPRADADPDARDRTVDLMWGFPAHLAAGAYRMRSPMKAPGNPLWLDDDLLFHLSRARSLPDHRRFDVDASEVALPGPAGLPLAGSALLPLVEGTLVHRAPRRGLMHGEPAEGYDPHSARALANLYGSRARAGNREPPPDSGACLGDLPDRCGIVVVDREGRGLDDVAVRAWRRAPGPDGRPVFSGEPVRAGRTRDHGHLSLSERERDPFFEGEREGPLDPGAGVLLLELSRDGATAWRFLDVVPFNLAFWGGNRAAHGEPVEVDLP